MLKTILIVLCLLALTACQSLQYAGNASYSVKPFKDDAGATICCAVDVHNGKEIANLEAHVSKQGDNYTVDLKEQGVAAFAGQQISSDALKVAVDGAVKAAVAAALAPVIPTLAPVVGAVGASGGLGAAAVGAGAVLGVEKLNAPVEPAK